MIPNLSSVVCRGPLSIGTRLVARRSQNVLVNVNCLQYDATKRKSRICSKSDIGILCLQHFSRIVDKIYVICLFFTHTIKICVNAFESVLMTLLEMLLVIREI